MSYGIKPPPPSWSYVGYAPCGCAVAISVDDGSKLCTQDVADFIREGYVVERRLTMFAKRDLGHVEGCPKKRNAAPRQESLV